jgi:formate dehydrogenase major subunit
VGLPYHWGTRGLVTGDSANDLVAMSEEPNVRIMETKALTCHARPGRLPRGREALEVMNEDLRRPA